MQATDRLKQWATLLERDAVALWIAAGDRRTPLAAKVVAGFVAAYALSPIDLIPDVIPVLGYLDDLLIVPLGIALAVRLIPPALMDEFRVEAAARAERPRSLAGLAGIVVLWLALVAVATFWAWRALQDCSGCSAF